MVSPLAIFLVAVLALLAVALLPGRRSGGLTRSAVAVIFVVAELWQFVFGVGSSLQLAAPGVGDRALWVTSRDGRAVGLGPGLAVSGFGLVVAVWD